MTQPLALFTDARAVVASLLRDALDGRSETYATGVNVGGKLPRSIETALPYVLVAVDSSTITYPIVARTTIRVTAWHHDEDQAYDLAQMCHALVIVNAPHGAAPATGPLVDVDPNTEVAFATFTCTVNTRS